MLDPSRIDRVLDAVRAAWEGQPDVELSTLFAMAQAQGYGWGTDDEQLLHVFGGFARRHPPTLAGAQQHTMLVTLVDSPTRVTLCQGKVVVRGFAADGEGSSAGVRPLQPVVWDYESVRPTGPGRPLVIKDLQGAEHRFGVIERLHVLQPGWDEGKALEQRAMGELVLVVHLADARVVIDHSVHVFSVGRRHVEYRKLKWSAIEQCRPGAPLVVQGPGGSKEENLGEVVAVHVAEAELIR